MSAHILLQNVVAVGASAFLALASSSTLAEPHDEAAIEQKLQQYEAWFNGGDVDALARLFEEDVVYYAPTGQVLEGREAVQQYYLRNLEAGFSDMTIDTIEIRILGNTAYDIARYTVSDPTGEPLTGYHLAILEKEDGEWIVRRTLVNAEMPEPPAQ